MAMTEKLDPQALAQLDDDDDRDGVQEVSPEGIQAYVMEAHSFPEVSACPFATWLIGVWFEFADERIPPMTNGQVIAGAVAHWTGGKA